MNIPFMRLDRQFSDIRSEIMAATETVLTHGRVLQGNEVEHLEQRLAKLLHLSHAVAVGSCTDALFFSLKALGLQPNQRVAVTSFSFVASASAIVNAGGIPIFLDIDPVHYLTQKEQLLQHIRKKEIAGIIAVHIYGQMLDLSDIYTEAQKNGIFVVEDAAQCLGATCQNMPPGQHSDITCLSFDPTKVIGAFGSGGVALTNQEHLKEKLVRLRYHGHSGNRVYNEVGFNSQLATIQAAWLDIKLNYLNPWQEKRQEIANIYNKRLGDLPHIRVPTALDGNQHIFHKYVLRIENGHREALESYLKKQGIATSVHYNTPLHQQPCFGAYATTQTPCPIAEKSAQEVLSLPIYPELTTDEVNHICDQIYAFCKENHTR